MQQNPASGTANGETFTDDATLTVTAAEVTGLTVTPATASVAKGLSQQFTAKASFSEGSTPLDVTSNAALTWETSDATIATIDDNGVARTLGVGTVTITASGTANGETFTDDATLTVTAAEVTGLTVTPATASVAKGLSQQFTAKASFSDGSTPLDVTSNAALTWETSDATIATIDDNGVARTLGVGTVTITASGTANGETFTDDATLTVTAAEVTGLTVTPATASVELGLSQQFTAKASFSDGSTLLDVTSNAALTWETSDATIATIDDNGVARTLGVGTVTITASGTANGETFTDDATLNVTEKSCTLDLVTAGNLTYTCPLTKAKADANGIYYTSTYSVNGFQYVSHDLNSANAYCTKRGGGYRLPTSGELGALFNAKGNMWAYGGWPINLVYWSSTASSTAGRHYTLDLSKGISSTGYDYSSYFVTCVR